MNQSLRYTGLNEETIMDNNEVKSAIETLGKTFESFKKTNDERLKQVEAKGTADPITEEKLSKI